MCRSVSHLRSQLLDGPGQMGARTVCIPTQFGNRRFVRIIRGHSPVSSSGDGLTRRNLLRSKVVRWSRWPERGGRARRGTFAPSRHSARGADVMADNVLKRGHPDRSRINMNEDHEVKYWTKHLAITRGELQRLVDKVGNSASAVRKELGAG